MSHGFLDHEGVSELWGTVKKYIKKYSSAGSDGNPIGTIISYMSTTAPKDYLVCDGTEYNVSDYPDLANFFEEQFESKYYFGGSDDKFAVPDMRNLFIRGYHGEADEQLSGEIGKKQEGTQSLTMEVILYSNKSGFINAHTPNLDELTAGKYYDSEIGQPGYLVSPDRPNLILSDDVKPMHTSRPVNMAVLFCIKATEAESYIPSGGTTGQVLTKRSDDDYDTYWADVEGGVTPPEPEKTGIYGIEWDGSASPICSRTDDALLFVDPSPYVADGQHPGSSPFDTLYPWSAMEKVEDSEAGMMVKIPKFWYKLTQVGTKGVKIQIADKETDGFSICPACMDRDDGNGPRDYVLVGRYHCAAGTYKSETKKLPKVSEAQASFRTNIHKLGTNVYMIDFATWFTIWLLYIVELANWNSQKTIGLGCGNNRGTENMGYTDSMSYHTGTTLSNRNTYGLGTQYRYLEGLWDNCYDRLTGCYNASTGLMVEVNPSKFEENSGGKSVGAPVSGWIAGLKVSNDGPFPCFISSDTSVDGEAAGVCDYWSFGASTPVVNVGGNFSQDGGLGMFCVGCATLENTNAHIGSRLMKLP